MDRRKSFICPCSNCKRKPKLGKCLRPSRNQSNPPITKLSILDWIVERKRG